jgi:SAM-dependent methyltransferase
VTDVQEKTKTVCDHEWRLKRGICCQFRECLKCGVTNKFERCSSHADRSIDAYEDFGYFWRPELYNLTQTGIPLNTQYIKEHERAIATVADGVASLGRTVLEVGAGIGRLVPMFLREGFEYEAVEINPWACQFIENAYNVKAHCCDISRFDLAKQFDLVVCVRLLEHLEHADRDLISISEFVAPHGFLYLLVPDKTDLYNPDYWWFFDLGVVRMWLRAVGLDVIGAHIDAREKETLLYVLASRSQR